MAEWSNAAVLKTVEGHTSGGSNPSLSANNKGLIINPLFYFQAMGLEKMGTKWGRNEMKPYRKPTIVDHDGDLSKQWYVYFKWWDEEKQCLVKAKRSRFQDGQSINRIHNKRERLYQLGLLRDTIDYLLSMGWTPNGKVPDQKVVPADMPEQIQKWAVAEALDEVKKIKEQTLSDFGFRSFKAKLHDFKKFLVANGKGGVAPDQLSRRDITEYLRHVKTNKGANGNEASARTRNNYLTELHAIFEKMIEEEMATKNPCKGIQKLRENVTRHQAFTREQVKLMGEWMEEHEPYLKKFSAFIGYAFLRPSEILRLKVKDIREDGIYLRAENAKTAQSVIIPVIDRLKPIIREILAEAKNPEDHLFTAEQKPGPKQVGGTQYFSKRFDLCRQYMNEEHGANFTHEHTLYAMRHTFIKDLYLHFKENMTRDQAEFRTMQITRHRTVSALRAYIRDYSMDKLEDWGKAYSIEY